MAKKHIDQLRTYWGIGTAILTGIAGICLMAACYSIYHAGDGFSREAVAAAFSPIAVPVYLCLGAVIGGWILHLVSPAKEKLRPGRQAALILNRLQKTKDLNQCGPTLQKDILAQRKIRRLHRIITLLLTAAGSIIFLTAALRPGAFHATQINESVIKAMRILLPCMAVPFGYGVFAAYFSEKSMNKEIELLKMVPNSPKQPSPASKSGGILAARLILTGAAVVLLVYGLATGGIADVLTKAINICTECVGLG